MPLSVRELLGAFIVSYCVVLPFFIVTFILNTSQDSGTLIKILQAKLTPETLPHNENPPINKLLEPEVTGVITPPILTFLTEVLVLSIMVLLLLTFQVFICAFYCSYLLFSSTILICKSFTL